MTQRRPVSRRAAVRLLAGGALALLMAGCATPGRYTSQDLALLPCEAGDSPIFFYPVEFDGAGNQRYPEQWGAIRARLGRPDFDRRVTDVVLFVHGWDKDAGAAESDYQNFLCRLHGRLRGVPGMEDTKRHGGLMMIGVFWPSTLSGRSPEPLLVKPFSYYPMRARADLEAQRALAPLLLGVKDAIATRANRASGDLRLNLAGHSFGGRMLVQALVQLQGDGQLQALVAAARSLNVVLVNAAVPAATFDGLQQAVDLAVKGRSRAGDSGGPPEGSYLFNVHSFNDAANRILFPVASLFDADGFGCAAGACGVAAYPTACADASGNIHARDAPPRAEDERGLATFNVDATSFVYDHSDIYKGRMALLLANLLYDRALRERLPSIAVPPGPAARRCG